MCVCILVPVVGEVVVNKKLFLLIGTQLWVTRDSFHLSA